MFFLDTRCADFGAFWIKHYKWYFLVVKRAGQYYSSGPLSNWKLFVNPLPATPGYTGGETAYHWYNSTPWSLLGKLDVWLEEGDEVGFFIWAGSLPAFGAGIVTTQLYYTTVQWHRFEIEQLQTTAIDTNIGDGVHTLAPLSPDYQIKFRFP